MVTPAKLKEFQLTNWQSW